MKILFAKSNKIILLSGSLSSFLYLLAALTSGENGISAFIVINAILFLIWFFTLKLLRKKSEITAAPVKSILIFALLFRVILLFSEPTTSDDVYRYLWEGKLVLNSVNPFEFPPDSEELAQYHTGNLPRLVSYPHMTTIYPPVAQYIFAAGYFISGESDFGLKLIYLLFDFLTILVLIKYLKFKNLPPCLSIIYAWLPLTIMEYFINSHIDVAGVFFLILILYLYETGRYALAAIPFALGVLVKLYPLLLIPFFILRFRVKQNLLFFGLVSVILIPLGFSFIPDVVPVTDSFSTYMENWSFYGSFFSLLKAVFSNQTARPITYVSLMLVIAVIAHIAKDINKAAYLTSISHIIFIPTLFPWYLGYLAVIHPFRRTFAVYWLFFAINFTNLTPLYEPWREYLWVGLLIYLPFFIFLSMDIKSLIKNKGEENKHPDEHQNK